ncbi:hypothetical protein BD626DRAFT_473337 [Schizophyllum amplum]|uniref:Uncharacterized protein n=1 Tax=Schizophyllum amplum TaxID=97359 RepID=A0A550CWP8_9AGAR|nr:hypothetical protein BD626DRAFT_473337 [Auriculariopsis ampla]
MSSLQTSSLHRKASNRTTRSDWTVNDGHVEGNLNCLALRHGWTRTFSIHPDEVGSIDYGTLETVLQLPTLKLRTMTTRIFVENPPNSGVWSKVRFWKDDGSLQSVLVQQFFAARMRDGIVTSFDVRDGHDRDDVMSIKSGMSGRSGVSRIVPGTGQTREWLKRRGMGARSPGAQTEATDDEGTEPDRTPKEAPKTGGRIQALKYIFGISSTPPAPPVRTQEEIEQELINEEEAMKKRGWLPPGVRRLGSKAKASSSSVRLASGNIFGNSSERDFFRRRRKQRQQTSDEDHEDPFAGDGEEINLSDADDRPPNASVPDINVINDGEEDAAEVQPQEGKKWFGLFGGAAAGPKTPEPEGDPSQSSTSLATISKSDNPFLGAGEKKSKKKDKGKKKAAAFTGAEMVKVPSDAFEAPEEGGTPKPSSAASSTHRD